MLALVPTRRVLVTLALLLCDPAAGSEVDTIMGEVGGNVTLPCRNASLGTDKVDWFKIGNDHPVLSLSWPTWNVRFEWGNQSSLQIKELQLEDEGNYTCMLVSSGNPQPQIQLLLAFLPKSPPECWAETSQAGFLVDLHCAWQGGYPHPVFQWRDGEKVLGQSESSTAGLGSMDHFAVTLDRSHLQSGKQFECRVIHILQQEPQTCTIRTTLPTLEPHPMEVCFSGGNVTLVCLTTSTNPPANFTWLKNINEPRLEIQPNEKYQITQNATSSLLTIHNCSRDIDEGYYVCRAENPLGVRELDVWLAVRSQRNIVGIVTALVILFIFAIGSITILILYCNPEFCLKVRSR
ncbi:V-set and immunoglobulin domain-containing protein 10 isoform X2 [Pleurodeles waltl]|uniref:V-set and immunoglobulin domain-containing protein 10 isoform X2 n=1 Tax=Pleurodeles waltl TaxID=8319 RepID=UPI0037095795